MTHDSHAPNALKNGTPASHFDGNVHTPPRNPTWMDILESSTEGGVIDEETAYYVLSDCLLNPAWYRDPIEGRLYEFLGICWGFPRLEAEIRRAMGDIPYSSREEREAYIRCIKDARAKLDGDGRENPQHDSAVTGSRCVIETLSELMASQIEMPKGIVDDLLFPGATTMIAAPKGSTKTICTHIMAYALASGGIFRGEALDKARVLIVDSDNPRSVVQQYMRNICDTYDIDLSVVTRDRVRPLLDKAFWQDLPIEQYDVVIIDSFGGVTPGISESEGAKLQVAMDVLKGIADRGPAVLVLDNTTKNAMSYRGRGEKTDRIDIAYEARDTTGWVPTGPEWWLDLPDS
jgi:hypothetical protein